jgi:excisionase family DNA binding protein
MTLDEVASYLRVHPSTVYRMAKTRAIPAFKIGSDWRFNRESIDGWRVGAERKPGAEVLSVAIPSSATELTR